VRQSSRTCAHFRAMFSGTTILAWVDSDLVDVDQIMTPGQVTDSYLLALAVKNRGQLATFDRRLSTRAVRRAELACTLSTRAGKGANSWWKSRLSLEYATRDAGGL